MNMATVSAGLRARYIDSFKMDHAAIVANPHGPAMTNWDLEPVDEERRNWNWKTFASYWISESWAVTQFTIGSQLVVSGLLWWHALLACAVAHLFGAAFAVLNCVSYGPFVLCLPEEEEQVDQGLKQVATET